VPALRVPTSTYLAPEDRRMDAEFSPVNAPGLPSRRSARRRGFGRSFQRGDTAPNVSAGGKDDRCVLRLPKCARTRRMKALASEGEWVIFQSPRRSSASFTSRVVVERGTTGEHLPSRNRGSGPPPVDTWLIFDASPALHAAADRRADDGRHPFAVRDRHGPAPTAFRRRTVAIRIRPWGVQMTSWR